MRPGLRWQGRCGAERAKCMRVLGFLLRAVGWLLILAALAVAGIEALHWWRTGEWQAIPAGKLWFDLHKDSLQLIQPVIERYIWPPLWNPVLFTVLQWPAWAVLGVPGLVLALVPGLRGRRRMFGERR